MARTTLCAVLLLFFLLAVPPGAARADPREALDVWLERQAKLETWAADVVQTRRLRSLVHPLESEGKVWFIQPNRFRWQLGDPPRTIAVRDDEELVVVYPRLEQVERYTYREEMDAAWRQALALLEVGFPSDAELFHERYDLLSGQRAEDRWHFELEPAAEDARRLIERVRIEVSSEDSILLATELTFPDGSSMRNDFHNHRLDPELDDSLFEVEIGEDYEVVEPLSP